MTEQPDELGLTIRDTAGKCFTVDWSCATIRDIEWMLDEHLRPLFTRLTVERDRARQQVVTLEALRDLFLQECPNCGGAGRVSFSRADHASDCDGRCLSCPVEVQDWDYCNCPGCSGYVPRAALEPQREASDA